MVYQSLYRRYRPGGFADIVGQRSVVSTLTNAITEDRLHHAYLFTGPRGTGKTSIARILAKAINCVEGPTPAPCGACESCVSITAGTALDVIELDMASHGGVDDARDLRERAQFAPTTGRRKVYILDEVHMASTAAFNALLKLVEEPPSHVLFAMATTDPQKVLPTILSRVQRLDLRRVAADEVAGLVRRIVATEGSEIEDVAVEAIVRAGDGSVRDTLSILEQVLTFSGERITGEATAQVLGTTAAATIERVTDLLATGDLAALLAAVAELVDGGQDLRRFTLDLVGHLRDVLVVQAAPDQPDLVDATEERRQALRVQAAHLPRERALEALEVLARTAADQRQGTPRLPLEIALARLTMPVGATSAAAPVVAPSAAPSAAPVSPAITAATRAAIPEPVAPAPTAAASTEQAPASIPATAPASGSVPAAASGSVSAAASVPVSSPAETEAANAVESSELLAASSPGSDVSDPPPVRPTPGPDTDLPTVVAKWDAIIELVRQASPRAKAVFEPAVPIRLSGGILTLRYGPRYSEFHAEQAMRSEMSDMLKDALRRACSLEVRIDVVRSDEDERARPRPPVVNAAADGAAPDAVAPADRGTEPSGTVPDRRSVAARGPGAGGAGASGEGDAVGEARDVAEADATPMQALDPEGIQALLATRLDARLEDDQATRG